MKKVVTTACGLLLTASFVTSDRAFAHARAGQGGSATTTTAQDPAAQQRKEYEELQKMKAEKDPIKVLEMGDAYFKAYPTNSYGKYVIAEMQRGRYGKYTALKEAGKFAEALAVAEEFQREAPKANPAAVDTELFFLYDLATAAQMVSNKLLQEKKDPSPILTEAAVYANKAIAAISAGKQDTSKVPQGKTWDDVKTTYLAYYHYVSANALFVSKKLTEAEPAIQKALEYGCSTYPDLFYKQGIIQIGRYEDKAKVYQALPDADKTGDKGKAALKEAFDEADKASVIFAKCINACKTSPNAAQLGGVAAAARKELEFSFGVTHEDKLDGLDAFIATQKDACK
jgi:tetratricopeptide (TPR) repeat protein